MRWWHHRATTPGRKVVNDSGFSDIPDRQAIFYLLWVLIGWAWVAGDIFERDVWGYSFWEELHSSHTSTFMFVRPLCSFYALGNKYNVWKCSRWWHSKTISCNLCALILVNMICIKFRGVKEMGFWKEKYWLSDGTHWHEGNQCRWDNISCFCS